MSRRLSAPLLSLAAFAGLLAAAPAPAVAAGMSSFRLTNTDPAGAQAVSKVLMSIVPPGTVTPPDPQTSPLTILDGSSGFKADDLKVSLGDGTTPSNQPFQALALDFGPGGLAPGGRLYFTLNTSPSFNGILQLVLPSSVSNLAVEQYTPPPGVIGSGGNNLPEPMSILLWGGMAGLALIRARAYRRAHEPAAAA